MGGSSGRIVTPASIGAATAANIAGAGRTVVAAADGVLLLGRQYTFLECRTIHTITAAASDLRFVYTTGSAREDISSNPINLKIGASLDNTTFSPVLFGGKQTGRLDPGGVLVSDPYPVDVAAGSTVWVTARLSQDFGVSTTLTSNSSIGATTLPIAAMPLITRGLVFVGVGATGETVSVDTITGSSAPYTMTLTPGTTCTKAHSTGDYVGQQLFSTQSVYASDNGGAQGFTAATATDRSYGGTFGAISPTTTTISGGSLIPAGSTMVPLVGLLNSPTLTLGAGGTLETITIVNIASVGGATPYRYYLATPTVFDHPAGETASTGVNSVYSFPPTAIVADRTASAPPAVVGVGTSIMQGTGYYLRAIRTYPDLAFAGNHPFVNLAVGGETLQAFLSVGSSVRRRQLLTLGSWLLVNYPTNDLSGGRTLVQIQADIATLVGMARRRGMRVALETCIPRTPSSDGWVTTANQTFYSFESARLGYNAWVRAGAGGLADLVVDTAAKLDSGLVVGSAETGRWLASTTNGPYTPDGTHPSTIGHIAMAAAINPALFV